MKQNTSSAVMQQRHEALDSLDDFPTPPWATRALFEMLDRDGPDWRGDGVVWEPACNRGFMAGPLREIFGRVFASDVFDYSGDPQGFAGPGGRRQDAVCDFLLPGSGPFAPGELDWIITNPPFVLGADFVHRALSLKPRRGVAMFVRSAFTEGQARHESLFGPTPPAIVAQFTERVILSRGRVRDPGRAFWDAGTETMKRPSTATAYCWLVWMPGSVSTEFRWIGPCRTWLERPGDYPVYPDEARPEGAAPLFSDQQGGGADAHR